MTTVEMRPATPADAEQLHRFPCSTGPWYEAEVEQQIQGDLAGRVGRGGTSSLSAFVADDAGEVVAVIACEVEPHPSGGPGTVTRITAGAVRLDRQGSSPDGTSLSSRILAAAVDQARASGSAGCYAMVAVANVRVRQAFDRGGFFPGPVPSDPRYLFYTLTLRA